MSDGGKGSTPRPIPDPKRFDENWEKIFGKRQPTKPMQPKLQVRLQPTEM